MRTADPAAWAPALRRAGLSKRFGQAPAGRARRALALSLRELRRRCDVSGLRHLTDPQASASERRLWRWALGALLLAAGGAAARLVLDAYAAPPALVAVSSLEHHIANISFPAVALCSYNLISLYKVAEYADALHAADPRLPAAAIRANLVKFGALFNFAVQRADLHFMHYLAAADPDVGANVTAVLLRISRTCEEQLLACSWAGRVVACGDLFALRITYYGLCCMFNGRYEPADAARAERRLALVGADRGLLVALRRNLSDAGYLRRRTVGTEILIFDGTEFPLPGGGRTRAYSAPVNMSTYLAVYVTQQAASRQARAVSESRRGCRMPEPARRLTYGWCLTRCQRAVLRLLCGCVPVMMQPAPGEPVCSVTHLDCLNKYKEKLLRYYPEGMNIDALREENSDSVYCPGCLPDCTWTIYTGSLYTSQYHYPMKLFRNYYTTVRRQKNSVNVSVIRVFYSTEAQQLLTLEVSARWFELLGSVGGAVSVLLGASLLLPSELLYHLTLRWRRHYVRLQRLN